MKLRAALLLLAFVVACGEAPDLDDAPPRPRAEDTSTPSGPANPHWDALNALTAANSPAEAHAARALYTGTEHAERLDDELRAKLSRFDLEAYHQAAAAIRATTTPGAARAAANTYTGTDHTDTIEQVLDEHVQELVRKDPTLEIRPLPESEFLKDVFWGCRTESEAAIRYAEYSGPASREELDATLEAWRWSKPDQFRTVEVPFAVSADTPFVRLRDGRIIAGATHDSAEGSADVEVRHGDVMVFGRNGSLMRVLTLEDRNLEILGVSHDERFLYTATPQHADDAVQKWNIASGELVLSFVRIDASLTLIASCTALVPDGSGVVAVDSAWNVTLWNTETGAAVHRFGVIPGVASLLFDGTSSRLFALSRTEGNHWTISQYELQSGRQVLQAEFQEPILPNPATISPDGRQLACVTFTPADPEDARPDEQESPTRSGGTHHLVLLDAASAEPKRSMELPAGNVAALTWLKSGKHLLLHSNRGLLFIDVERMEVLHTHQFRAHSSLMVAVGTDRASVTVHHGTEMDGRARKHTEFTTLGRRP